MMNYGNQEHSYTSPKDSIASAIAAASLYLRHAAPNNQNREKRTFSFNNIRELIQLRKSFTGTSDIFDMIGPHGYKIGTE